jgi:hypothetical protein
MMSHASLVIQTVSERRLGKLIKSSVNPEDAKTKSACNVLRGVSIVRQGCLLPGKGIDAL